MLRIADTTKAPEVETSYTFPLDPFQKCAVAAIQAEENVLVTAKTGSGKTLVGEYQIEYSLKKGGRVFYTTPIKSLSNQKFHDLSILYPGKVGIMTGDIKFAPQSDVVVMTTEILRNLLFKIGSSTEHIGSTAALSLDGVDAIVFDEVHYFNDPARGKVWEECLILLPPRIRLVLLSATIESPDVFAQWIGEMKQVPTHLISTQYRVVPLEHRVREKLLMDEKDQFNGQAYSEYLRYLKGVDDANRKHSDAVKARVAGDPVVAREIRSNGFLHQMNEMVDTLRQENKLPAMFFVFSRKNCETYASKVTSTLIDASEGAVIKHRVNFHLSRYPELKKLPQYHTLMDLLMKGVAFHHSGMLPVLKEIVEMLFAGGHLKLLFATETFAVGINMPTKTVIFTSYRKYDDDVGGLRMLRTDEYIQMAGRAGRRGKDVRGFVYYLPDRKPEELEDVRTMMKGKQQSLESRMDFHYDFLLKCLQNGTTGWMGMMEKSYWHDQRQRELDIHKAEVRELQGKYSGLDVAVFELREMYETQIRATQNAERKRIQAQLDGWKNKHVGPKWEKGWQDFKEFKKNREKIARLEEKIEAATKIEVPFLVNLQRLGYADGDGETLTELGVMASEINEGNPLVMSKMFGQFNLPRSELIALLSCFVEGEKTEDPITVSCLRLPDTLKNALLAAHIIAQDLYSHENPKSRPEYWTIHNYWPEIVYRWMEGDEMGVLCAEYEVYEGNFMKAILKTANIVDEWVTLATYTKTLEVLEVLREFRTDLVRGLVVPDSLYLRL
uniref:Helicase n=1 Tax=viral metagenome TaxID=1070528 RepID=A0A6C0B4M0_9ZZZZ